MSLLDASQRSTGSVEVGISNYLSNQAAALQAHLGFAIATDRPQCSLLSTGPLRDGTLDRAMAAGTTPLAWSPLGGGAALSVSLDRADVYGLLQAAEGIPLP